MALMTIELAKALPAETRAQILFHLDDSLRHNIDDERIFEEWLMCGVPDGTENWWELCYESVEDFVEMWNLAERLLNWDVRGYDEDEDE